MDMKEKYWKTLARFCFGLYYYKEQLRFCVNFDRTLRIVLAVISASSVASWGIWSQYAQLWSVIIGASQLLIIISELLPYKDRISKLQELRSKLSAIYGQMENQWREVKGGEKTEDEINDLISASVEQWSKAEAKYIKDDILPEWKWMVKRAQKAAEKYIVTFIGGVKNEEISN